MYRSANEPQQLPVRHGNRDDQKTGDKFNDHKLSRLGMRKSFFFDAVVRKKVGVVLVNKKPPFTGYEDRHQQHTGMDVHGLGPRGKTNHQERQCRFPPENDACQIDQQDSNGEKNQRISRKSGQNRVDDSHHPLVQFQAH
jgi:hypothetical protein